MAKFYLRALEYAKLSKLPVYRKLGSSLKWVLPILILMSQVCSFQAMATISCESLIFQDLDSLKNHLKVNSKVQKYDDLLKSRAVMQRNPYSGLYSIGRPLNTEAWPGVGEATHLYDIAVPAFNSIIDTLGHSFAIPNVVRLIPLLGTNDIAYTMAGVPNISISPGHPDSFQKYLLVHEFGHLVYEKSLFDYLKTEKAKEYYQRHLDYYGRQSINQAAAFEVERKSGFEEELKTANSVYSSIEHSRSTINFHKFIKLTSDPFAELFSDSLFAVFFRDSIDDAKLEEMVSGVSFRVELRQNIQQLFPHSFLSKTRLWLWKNRISAVRTSDEQKRFIVTLIKTMASMAEKIILEDEAKRPWLNHIRINKEGRYYWNSILAATAGRAFYHRLNDDFISEFCRIEKLD